MIRHCDGTDPTLVKEKSDVNMWDCSGGYEPCDCGLTFDDVERMTVYPHERV
jgi:hypothetical protein